MNFQVITCDDLSAYANSQEDAEIIDSLAVFLKEEAEREDNLCDKKVTQVHLDQNLYHDNNSPTILVNNGIVLTETNLTGTIKSPSDDEKIYTPLESVRFDEIHNEAEQQTDNLSYDDELVFKDEIIENPGISIFDRECFSENISQQNNTELLKLTQNQFSNTIENDFQKSAISNIDLDKNYTSDNFLCKNNHEIHDKKTYESFPEKLSNKFTTRNNDGGKQKRMRKKSKKLFNYPYYITRKKNYCESQEPHNYNLRPKIKRRKKSVENSTENHATEPMSKIMDTSNNSVDDHFNNRSYTRIEKEVNATHYEYASTKLDLSSKTNNNKKDENGSSVKECDKFFIRPATPVKHKNDQILDRSSQKNRNDSFSANLTDEDKILLSSNIDTPTSSDNEFEQICNFMKNNNCHSEQFSFDSIELLNEFKDIDQSTNERLLADLLSSPKISLNGQCDSDSSRNNTSTPLLSSIKNRHKENSDCNDSENNLSSIFNDNRNNQNIKMNENVPDSLDKNNSSACKLQKEIKSPLTRSRNKTNSHDKQGIVGHHDIETESDADDEELDEDIKKKIEETKKSFKISDNILAKLKILSIKLQHDVPPQHQLENGVCKPPTEKIMELFQKHASLKMGYYSSEEDRIIKTNWKSFCKNHDWDPKIVEPFLNFHYGGKTIILYNKAIKFVQFLSQNLPNRTLYSVLSRFRALYSNKRSKKFPKRRDYTIEEDKLILKYLQDESIEKYNEKVKILSRILNRSMRSIYLHHKKLKKLNNYYKSTLPKKRKIRQLITWNIELTEKFLTNLKKLTLSKTIEDLFDQKIPSVVWNKLENVMKISWQELRNYWTTKLHMQLFSKNPIFVNDIKVMLIELLYLKKVKKMEDLNWNEFSQYFDSATPEYLKALFYNILKRHHKASDENLHRCIKWLFRKKIPFLKTTLIEKYLPRLSFENNKIEIIDKFNVLNKKNNKHN